MCSLASQCLTLHLTSVGPVTSGLLERERDRTPQRPLGPIPVAAWSEDNALCGASGARACVLPLRSLPFARQQKTLDIWSPYLRESGSLPQDVHRRAGQEAYQ